MEVGGCRRFRDRVQLKLWLRQFAESYGFHELDPEFLEELADLVESPQEAPTAAPKAPSVSLCRGLGARCSPERRVNCGVHGLILVGSAGYALDFSMAKYPEAIATFGGLVFVARLGGMACALETGVLFLSMARPALSRLSTWLPGTWQLPWAILEAHRQIHIEAAGAMCVYSGLHVVAHCLGTVPALMERSPAELNALLGCARRDPPFLLGVDMSFLAWPECPVAEASLPESFAEALFATMPGLSGSLLLIVLGTLVVSYMVRHRCYEVLEHSHRLAIFAWPLLLLFHGSQQWIGVGIPLVLLVAGIPLALFAVGRVRESCRVKPAAIQRATVVFRGDQPVMVRLDMELGQQRYRPGMYFRLCCPDIACGELHSFSSTTGKDSSLSFTIQHRGRWTGALLQHAAQAVDAQKLERMPRLLCWGGYLAPAQSAPQQQAVLLVGRGVGMTPMLAAWTSIQQSLAAGNQSLLEARFLWEVYEADHFALHGEVLAAWGAASPQLREKLSMHLYCSREAAEDPREDARFREILALHSGAAATLRAKLSPSARVRAVPPLVPQQLPYLPVTLGVPDYLQHIRDICCRHLAGRVPIRMMLNCAPESSATPMRRISPYIREQTVCK